MADNSRRFNLQFNLDKEDENFAAAILDNMGRKKSAIVTKALIALFKNNPKDIENTKNFNLSNEKDLLFRANLRLQNDELNTKNVAQTNSVKKNLFVAKNKKSEPNVENSSVDIISDMPVSVEKTEDKNALDDLLDGLDAFF